jgi:hypothetical protein
MSTVHVRFEMVEVASDDGQPTTGYRAYAADIGLSAEGTDLTTVISTTKTAIDTYLGKTTAPIWMKGEIRFSSE